MGDSIQSRYFLNNCRQRYCSATFSRSGKSGVAIYYGIKLFICYNQRMEYYYRTQTPFGKMVLSEKDGALAELSFDEGKYRGEQKETPLLRAAAQQLSGYFSGQRIDFDLPLNPIGTEFQKAVWDALLNIPFGETKSYAQVAAEVGNDKAARAVGGAVGKNPIPIIIPCHRVLAANNKIGGFSLGLDMKRKLLGIEGISVDS